MCQNDWWALGKDFEKIQTKFKTPICVPTSLGGWSYPTKCLWVLKVRIISLQISGVVWKKKNANPLFLPSRFYKVAHTKIAGRGYKQLPCQSQLKLGWVRLWQYCVTFDFTGLFSVEVPFIYIAMYWANWQLSGKVIEMFRTWQLAVSSKLLLKNSFSTAYSLRWG